MKNPAAKIFACLLCCLMGKASAGTASDLLQQGVAVQRAIIPLYATGSFKLSAVVRVDRAYLDYRRKGFFRIGLLPLIVLDGVTFEARDANVPFASLVCIRNWMATKAGQQTEMREFKFIFSPTNRVEAGLARCVDKDHWELLKGVRYISGSEETQASRGALIIGGPRIGQVILDTTPPSINTVLGVSLTLSDPASPLVPTVYSSK